MKFDRQDEEINSQASDQQIVSLISSTLNTEQKNEAYKKPKRNKITKHFQEDLITNKAQPHKYESNNFSQFNQRKGSIQSSKSQQTIIGILKHRQSIGKNLNQEFEDEDIHNNEEISCISPQTKTKRVKVTKSEYKKDQQSYDIQSTHQKSTPRHKRLGSELGLNNNMIVKAKNMTSPQFSRSITSRPGLQQNQMQQIRKKASNYRETIEDIKDSEEESKQLRRNKSIRNQQQNQKSNSIGQKQHLSNNTLKGSISASPQHTLKQMVPPFGRASTTKFGMLFKLQKKTILDEGIDQIDEGLLNSSKNNSFGKQQIRKMNDNSVEEPSDSNEENQTQDLKLEYIKLKSTLEQLHSGEKSNYNSNQKPGTLRSPRRQNEQRSNTIQRDHQSSSKNLINKFGLKHKRSTKEVLSPVDAESRISKYRGHQDSLERELLENLNDGSSIKYKESNYDQSSEQQLNSSFYTQYTKKSKRRQSARPNQQKHNKSKLKQKVNISSDSCTTCNNNDYFSDNSNSKSYRARQKSKSKHRNMSKTKKSAKKLHHQMHTQPNDPVQMPQFYPFGVMTPQMMMFGQPQMPMMSSYPSFHNQGPMAQNSALAFFNQQHQYFNLMVQQMQNMQNIQQQQQYQQQFVNSTPDPAKQVQEDKLIKQSSDPRQSLSNSNNFYTFNQSNILINSNEGVQFPYNVKVQNTSNNNQFVNGPTQQNDFTSQQIANISTNLTTKHGNVSPSLRHNLSNKTLNSTSQDMVSNIDQTFKESHFNMNKESIQKQNSQDHQNSQIQIGSPLSNISRIDIQSTLNNADNQNSTAAHSQLAIQPKQQKTSSQSKEQAKEANQKYLSQLKTKFLKGIVAANNVVEETLKDQQATLEDRQQFSPLLQETRNSICTINQSISNPVKTKIVTGYQPSVLDKYNQQSIEDQLNKQRTSLYPIQSRSSSQSPQKLPQSVILDQEPVEEKRFGVFQQTHKSQYSSDNVNVFSSKRLSNANDQQLHNLTQKQIQAQQTRKSSIQEATVKSLIKLERHRSPQPQQQNQNVTIQNKLKMLNQRLSSQNDQYSSPQQQTIEQENGAQSHRRKESLQISKPLFETFKVTSQERMSYQEEALFSHRLQKIKDIEEVYESDQKVLSPKIYVKEKSIEEDYKAVTSKNDEDDAPTQLLVFDMKPLNSKPRTTKRQLGLQLLSPKSNQQDLSSKSSIANADDSKIVSKVKPKLKNSQAEASFSSVSKSNQITPKAQTQTKFNLNHKTEQPIKKVQTIAQTKPQKEVKEPSKQSSGGIADLIKQKRQQNEKKKDKVEIFVEIFDQPKKSEEPETKPKQMIPAKEIPMHDVFQKKVQSKISNYEKKQNPSVEQSPAKTIEEVKQVKNEGKSKQELIELRKQMMKSKVQTKKDNFVPESNQNSNDKNKSKDPPAELMTRLAMGQRAQIDTKEIKKLTNKNYENLPEIKKKKEDEKKKEELKQRQQQVKKFAEEVEKKRRKQFLKKQTNMVNEEFI